jgi:hypothetical protein
MAASQRRSKFGFFVFNHARVRPLTYREPMRFGSLPNRLAPYRTTTGVPFATR